MTDVMLINDLAIPVARVSHSIGRIDSSRRGYGGQFAQASRGNVHRLSVETIPIRGVKADFLAALIDGHFHTWNFEDSLWSYDGIGPDSGYAVTFGTTGKKKYGTYGIDVTSGTLDYTFKTIPVGQAWTCLFWLNGTTHYGISNSGPTDTGGTCLANGSPTSIPGIFNVAGSQLQLGPDEFDDVVWIWGGADSDLLGEIYTAHAVQAWSLGPRLRVGGEVISALHGASDWYRDMVCTKMSANALQGQDPDDGWDPSMKVLSFTLESFDPIFGF